MRTIEILSIIPIIVAPFVLIIFSLVTAYVLKFGIPKTNIIPDYLSFALAVVAGLLLGGAI